MNRFVIRERSLFNRKSFLAYFSTFWYFYIGIKLHILAPPPPQKKKSQNKNKIEYIGAIWRVMQV